LKAGSTSTAFSWLSVLTGWTNRVMTLRRLQSLQGFGIDFLDNELAFDLAESSGVEKLMTGPKHIFGLSPVLDVHGPGGGVRKHPV